MAAFFSEMRLRTLLTLLLVFLLALGAAACGGGGGEKSSDDVPANAIALVGDDEVLKSEFDDLFARAEASYDARDQEFPKTGTAEYDDLKKRAVEFLVQQHQFALAAADEGIEVTDEEVQERLAKIKKDSFQDDDEKFAEALEKEGLTLEDAEKAFHDQILQEKLYKQVTDEVKPSEAEMEKYYEDNKEQFSQPESRDVSHILVKTKAKADALYAELEDGANFATLAKQNSTDPGSKKSGGKLPVTKGSTVAPFDKVAFELDTGEYSKPIKTEFGWHIVKADSDVKPATTTPYEDVKPSIEQQLAQEGQQKAIDAWLEELKKTYPVVYAVGFAPPKVTTTDTGATPTTTE
jgi:parvulin-like peptidyl-prolyl isomerase